MRRPSLHTWKTNFILFLTVESHYRTSTMRHQHTTAQLCHTAAWYSTLQSSTTIKILFIIVLKIAITKCQHHSLPAVQCMEIALHPISPYDWHPHSLSSLPSITRSIIHDTVHSFQQLSTNMKAHNHSQSVTWPPQSSVDLHCTYVLPSILHYYFLSTVCFNLPSLVLFLCPLLYSLCSENFIFQIHLFTFKFVSFIFTPYKISLLHSHLFNIQNPCI